MIPAQNVHEIVIDSPVSAHCSAILAGLIKPCLSWKAAFYRQGLYKKERTEYDKTILTKDKKYPRYYLWPGLINHIAEYCDKNGILLSVIDKSQEEVEIYEPELPGITFRKDQLRLIDGFLDSPRGILVSFTGSGKTVLGFGILGSFSSEFSALWLCHKKDLMQQAYDEGIKFGFDCGRVGDGFAEHGHQITIATRQSFKKIADSKGHLYDIVVVDEVHHVAGQDSEYAYTLARVPAPIRLGLTATLPREGESYLVAVGLIGPIIEELTINEGNDLGILAKPNIKILRVPKNHDVAALRQYAEVYYQGITANVARNRMIANTAKRHSDAGETVLIMINQIAHGENIQAMLDDMGVKNEFIRGSTKSEKRVETKHALNDKDIHVVICSSVWTEGVNIPTLQVVINAAGGKAEIGVLQSIGRGLRKTKDKDMVWIYDFFDNSHRFLIEHFGERLIIYIDNGWI
jgi:superfamily II DNA or RNA helicase